MFAILMISAKMATLGLRIKAYDKDKDYDFTISTNEVIRNILSRESNYIVDVDL